MQDLELLLQHGTNDAGPRPGVFSPEELVEAREARCAARRRKGASWKRLCKMEAGLRGMMWVLVRLTTYPFFPHLFTHPSGPGRYRRAAYHVTDGRFWLRRSPADGASPPLSVLPPPFPHLVTAHCSASTHSGHTRVLLLDPRKRSTAFCVSVYRPH
jgi:hypothetical protein